MRLRSKHAKPSTIYERAEAPVISEERMQEIYPGLVACGARPNMTHYEILELVAARVAGVETPAGYADYDA